MAPFFPDAMTIRATIPEFSYNDVQILLRIILLPFSSVYLRSLNVLEKITTWMQETSSHEQHRQQTRSKI